MTRYKGWRKKTGSKYSNKLCREDGICFDSKMELARYRVLKALQNAHVIEDLKCHPRYDLWVEGQKICTYEADFEYRTAPDGIELRSIVEDVKGFKTDVYKLKANLFMALYPHLEFHELSKPAPKKPRRKRAK